MFVVLLQCWITILNIIIRPIKMTLIPTFTSHFKHTQNLATQLNLLNSNHSLIN